MSKEKILIVDDILANRVLLKQMLLRMADYIVIEAVNGKEAVELAESENPSLILMDINMPEMGGMESASMIKKAAGDIYTPIIFVTALSAESSLNNALASGGDDFISKPFEQAVLKSKIIAHLRIRDLNQQLLVKNTQLNEVNETLSHEQELIEYFFESALTLSFLDKRFINYHMSSMSTFNGDVFLAKRSPQGSLYIVMGDFTGHGLTAAMGTLPLAMIFFSMVSKNMAIADIAFEINHQLFKLMPISMFFSATLLELNSQGTILTVWMGGMPESYWLGSGGELKGTIQSQHMPLGILHDGGFDSAVEIFSIDKDDQFYLYSDGVIEAEDAIGRIFGSERLENILVSNSDNRIEKVLHALNDFSGEAAQSDDITLVELTCRDMSVLENVKVEDISISSVLPWKMSVSLSAHDMQDDNLLEEISGLLGSPAILHGHKDVISVLLSEIYFNALDYSILGLADIKKNDEEQFEEYYRIRAEKLKQLSDASIQFDFVCSMNTNENEQQLLIRIKDNGKGYRGHNEDTSGDKLHGRGLAIVKSLCEDVTFSDGGRVLELVFRL